MRLRSRNSVVCAIAASVSLAAIAAAVSPSRAPAQVSATTSVTVKMTEYHFQLSVNHVPTGTVAFTVINKGQLPHTFEIQRLQKVTPVIQPGHRFVLKIRFRKPGKYYYLCTVGAHVQYGMWGNLRVTA
jgi:plastocyanin